MTDSVLKGPLYQGSANPCEVYDGNGYRVATCPTPEHAAALVAAVGEGEGMREALEPFAILADELEGEAHRAIQVGGYVPLDDDIEVYSVKNGDLYRARAALTREKTDG